MNESFCVVQTECTQQAKQFLPCHLRVRVLGSFIDFCLLWSGRWNPSNGFIKRRARNSYPTRFVMLLVHGHIHNCTFAPHAHEPNLENSRMPCDCRRFDHDSCVGYCRARCGVAVVPLQRHLRYGFGPYEPSYLRQGTLPGPKRDRSSL